MSISRTIRCRGLPIVGKSTRRATYARELGAAVAALGNSAALLDVQQTELATGSLDDSGPVGSSVVAKESGSAHGVAKNACEGVRVRSDRDVEYSKGTHGLRRR